MKRQAKKKQPPEIEAFIPRKPKAWKITELEEVHVEVVKMDILDCSPPHDADVYISLSLDNRPPVKTHTKSSSGGSTTFFNETLKIYLGKRFAMDQCMMKVQLNDARHELNDALGEVDIDLSWVLNDLPSLPSRWTLRYPPGNLERRFIPFQLTRAKTFQAMGTIHLAFCHVQRTADELAEPAHPWGAAGTESSESSRVIKCLHLRAPAPLIAHADDSFSLYTAEGEDEKFSSSDLEQHEEEPWYAEETQKEVIIRQPTADHYFYNNLIIIDSQRLAASPTEELATWIAKTGTT